VQSCCHHGHQGGARSWSPKRVGEVFSESQEQLLRRYSADRLTVADVAVRHPKVLGVDATLSTAAAAFEDDHVHMVLLLDGEFLAGTIVRSDIAGQHARHQRAVLASRLHGRVFTAGTPLAEAIAVLRQHHQRRRAVINDRGELVGLLCLKRSSRGFCSDVDVAARATERVPLSP
jgi:CBS domain-containing protein